MFTKWHPQDLMYHPQDILKGGSTSKVADNHVDGLWIHQEDHTFLYDFIAFLALRHIFVK